MTSRFSFIAMAALSGLLATSLLARADRNPDFDDDAKPILSMQPGLLQYVEHTFVVKDSGVAKFPGTDERRPMPPFIFSAKARGEAGPFHLRLLIQPGPTGHILNVVDMNHVNLPPGAVPPSNAMGAQPPAVAQQPVTSNPQPEPAQPTTAQPPASPSPTSSSAAPTADTPSGPINSNTPSGPVSSGNSLAPPPDPAPQQ